MKKLVLILALVVLSATLLISCTPEVEDNDNVEESGVTVAPLTTEELQAKVDGIYEKYPLPFMVGTLPAEMINADSYNYYTGLVDDSKVNALVVSESMIGSQAYSLVMLSAKEGEDANAIADEMINGINQRKWMCVEADLIRTVVSGNTVMLVMIDSDMEIGIDGFVDAFKEVVGEISYEASKK